MNGLTKITASHQRLADIVYEQILNALHEGDLSSDERLHQVKLAEMLNVSRTPVREALLRLEQEGILVSTRNGGFEIKKISQQDVSDIYQAREAIEGFGVGHLAEIADANILNELRELVSAKEKIVPQNAYEFYEANREIHRSFILATNNNYLLEMFDALWNRSICIHIFQTMEEQSLEASLSGHLALCDAIQTGDFMLAQTAMREHIKDGYELQIAALKSTG